MVKRSNIHVFVIVAIGFFLIVGAFIGLRFLTNQKTEPVNTIQLSYGDIEKRVLANGVLAPSELVAVGAQISGRVVTLNVEIGDRVQKGDLIAEIDSSSQTNRVLEAGTEIALLKAQKERFQAELEQKQLEFNRQSTLQDAGFGAKANFDIAYNALKIAKANLQVACAQIRKARFTQSTANLDLSYTKIIAPISGTVLAVVTKRGQTINANQTAPTIIKIGQTDQMTVEAQISEADIALVHTGQSAYFTVLGNPDRKYRAILKRIASAPDLIETQDRLSSNGNSNAIYYSAIFNVIIPTVLYVHL